MLNAKPILVIQASSEAVAEGVATSENIFEQIKKDYHVLVIYRADLRQDLAIHVMNGEDIDEETKAKITESVLCL